MEIIFILLFLYIIIFILSVFWKDNSIADVFWWIGFIIIACYLFLFKWLNTIPQYTTLFLLLFWWIRLSSYILKRKLKNKEEDYRYAEWRKTWNFFYLRSFFQVYMLQMILMIVVSIPLFFIFSNNEISNVYLIIWSIVSIFWLIFEITADHQVRKYIKENWKTKKVFTSWLYKYSRNPNYFWESTFWLWISIIWLWVNILSLIGYFTITFLLLYVSWVPLKEKRQEKKENWKEYKSKTNTFFPWFPKN